MQQNVDEKRVLSDEEFILKELDTSMRTYYFNNKQYSVFLDERGTDETPTTDILNELAISPQDDISKVIRINNIVSKYVNLDDIIGKVVESVYVNINTRYRLSYPEIEGRNKAKKAAAARKTIEDLNNEIKLSRVIREYASRTFQEGTVILYLRSDETGWVVDYFPLGVAFIAPYKIGGEPVVMIDINKLSSKLQKAGLKTKKGKDMFFRTVEEEIKENYPKEVYDAYIAKDTYAKLDVRYSGVLRIGNCGKKYGISPIFRAIPSAVLLQNFYKSDEVNSKARGRKILAQYLKKELLGQAGEKNPFQQQTFSHRELINACNRKGSIFYTAPGYVEKIEYVEPSSDLINTDTITYHLNREMSTLGIGFLSTNGTQSVSTAKLSLDQLMKTINSIAEQLEELLEKWYQQVLLDEHNLPEYAPRLTIIDSQALDFELQKDLATLLYSTMNLSLRSTLDILGYDVDEEKVRRKAENDADFENIFKARATSFTASGSGDNEGGRPESKEKTNKTEYDDTYNEDAR